MDISTNNNLEYCTKFSQMMYDGFDGVDEAQIIWAADYFVRSTVLKHRGLRPFLQS